MTENSGFDINGIIINLVSEGILWVLSKVYRKLGYGEQELPSEINELLKSAIEEEAYYFEWNGVSRFEEVGLFLNSPEAEQIIRQVFSSQIADNVAGIDEIREQFVILLAYQLDVEESLVRTDAENLFDNMLSRCTALFEAMTEKGILSAHEALSNQRHQMVLNELHAIKKNLEFLSGKRKLNLNRINKYDEKYRSQMAMQYGTLMPPVFNAERRKVPINDLYVVSNFLAGSEEKIISMADFVSSIHRTVLLGNPGGGKSTFAFKLCHDLAVGNIRLGNRSLTPILVTLREYASLKKQQNLSIIDFITLKSKEDLQLGTPPWGFFEYLLLNGRAIVVFDGLDELLDTTYRQEIAKNIELFCNLFPSVPVFVTSREVGYSQVPLNDQIFDLYRLAPFNEDQIAEYVTKWFASDTQLSQKDRDRLAAAFLNESKVVPNDLKSSPLLLALMCNMYHGEGYLPKKRPEVYERCSIMLFEKWDKSRDINVNLPFESDIRPTMMYLAFWIFQDPELQNGVTENKLIAKATEYLYPKRFDDKDDARIAATKFIEFCRGRAWVFTDTGTTSSGESLYQFTHRTFLEYFSAAYLVRIHGTTQKLLKILTPRIARQEWEIVAQLAFHMFASDNENGSDELILSLIDKAARSKRSTETYNYLSFAARTLNFLVPASSTTKRVTHDCLTWSINWSTGQYLLLTTAEKHVTYSDDKSIAMIGSLVSVNEENRNAVAKQLKEILVREIQSGIESRDLIALDISYTLILVFNRETATNSQFWVDLSDSIYSVCRNHILTSLIQKHIRACSYPFTKGDLTIRQLLTLYRFEDLCRDVGHLAYRSINYFSIFAFPFYIDSLQFYTIKPHFQEAVIDMGNLFLIHGEKIDITNCDGNYLSEIAKRTSSLRKDDKDSNNNPDLLFGLLTMFGVAAEMSSIRTFLLNTHHSVLNHFRQILSARFQIVQDEAVQLELDACQFTVEQQRFIWRWIRRETNLTVGKPAEAETY